MEEKDVLIITEGMIDSLALGNPICVNGVWIAIPENLETRLVEGVENRWIKEYGLDGAQEEEE